MLLIVSSPTNSSSLLELPITLPHSPAFSSPATSPDTHNRVFITVDCLVNVILPGCALHIHV